MNSSPTRTEAAQIIRQHFVSVLVHGALLAAAFFTARVPFGGELAIVSTLCTILLCIPTAYGCARWLGSVRGSALLIVLGCLACGIEYTALTTGFPYGVFSYGEKAGTLLLGQVPWSTPFSWVTIVLGCYAFVSRFAATWWRQILGTVGLMLCVDAVLDPIAVSLGLWSYAAPGVYYDVPLSNFVGWVLSSALGAGVVYVFSSYTRAKHLSLPTSLSTGLYYSLILWLGLAFFSYLFVPTMVGLILVVAFFLYRQTE
jgi:putative membrane protein